MKSVITYLNEMKEQKIIEEYAIGGATALIYYFEPVQTQDIDVFIILKETNSLLVSLTPIFNFLESKGGVLKDEYIIIHNTPVQFLVAYNQLVEEALQNSHIVFYLDTEVLIFSLEYLMAIMVQTSRGKDKARLEEIIKVNLNFDKLKFESILNKYSLDSKWEKIKSGFDL